MGTRRLLRDHADALLAVGLTVLLQLEIWTGWATSPEDAAESPTGAMRIVLAALGLALTSSVGARRRMPLMGLVLAFPMLAAIGPGGLDGWPALLLTLAVVTFSVGSETRDGTAVTGAIGVVGLIVMAVVRDPDALANPGDLFVPAVILGGAWLAGLALRVRRDQVLTAEMQAAEMERSREAATRAAIEGERARIARDLHDVVAHAIGVVVVQARGGRHAIEDDPGAAREAFSSIESTAVGALGEMRRLVGILRTDGEGDGRDPRPGLADLGRLADEVRAAGLPVDISVQGDPVNLPPGIDLSAYRIIQEALTNTLRHAGPATATVRVWYGIEAVDIEIADTGSTEGPIGEGHGLVGMRERAALVGGHVEAGPRRDGGYTVRAHLPLDGAPA